jgi:HSP20 family protein
MAIIPWDKFEGFDFGSPDISPAIDVYETKDGIVAEIRKLKGKIGDLDISIQKGVLYIKGESSLKEEKKGKGFWKKKTKEESFEKVIQLPAGIDAVAAKGTFKGGVVRIFIPKAKGKERADKKIEIGEL